MNADRTAVEAKPPFGVTFSATSIAAGGTVTITTTDPARVFIDGVLVGTTAEPLEVLFEEAGTYEARIEGIYQSARPDPQSIEVT